MGALNWLFYMGVVYIIYVNVAKKERLVEHSIKSNFLPGNVYTADICYHISLAETIESGNRYKIHTPWIKLKIIDTVITLFVMNLLNVWE